MLQMSHFKQSRYTAVSSTDVEEKGTSEAPFDYSGYPEEVPYSVRRTATVVGCLYAIITGILVSMPSCGCLTVCLAKSNRKLPLFMRCPFLFQQSWHGTAFAILQPVVRSFLTTFLPLVMLLFGPSSPLDVRHLLR
ncbi:hypothetical protein CEUSTIGMA_g5375.t1 [Chlamydomonas eustigma]|uniref:Uncharacterized protein n=1 Tax=Chlamydomonas eustigma TaxID=1157962 RepID=A0A250X4C9_9CHLO|nr:hypothetical protein CEUSTIGMA_g5375.t1 [Chlamydomonas eustigma]|eukprot:GAX77933.1 hypothetical protein CEUSTIGMA_g5375.t1 [Chlamydomonas eustigma]